MAGNAEVIGKNTTNNYTLSIRKPRELYWHIICAFAV